MYRWAFPTALALVLLAAFPARGASPEEAAGRLVERLLPGRSQQFVFERIPPQDGRDVFELESREGKVVVRGNSALSMACGLNWYLTLADVDNQAGAARVAEVAAYCDGPNMGSAGGPTLQELGAVARLRYEGLLVSR